VATYALIHGAGDVGWYWHLVQAELENRGHEVVAVDLPCDDESAGLAAYTDVVVNAIGDRTDLVVVAQSFGGYTAPLVCSRVPSQLMVLVAGMVPLPGESASEMFANTGWGQSGEETEDGTVDEIDRAIAAFCHDVPRDLAVEALSKGKDQADAPFEEPWPLDAWPKVPTRYILGSRDRFFPPDWTRRVVRERLGIEPDEIESSHCLALSRPVELAERLEACRTELQGRE
jgi:pimeloyl-ACP methyl ester carboxylesterase